MRAVGVWDEAVGVEEGGKGVWHTRDAVALLVGELVEKGLFMYGWYVQKLIARGITDLSLPGVS